MRKDDEKIVDLEDCELKHETARAWLIVYKGQEHRIPKSLGDYHHSEDVMVVPYWFAKKERII